MDLTEWITDVIDALGAWGVAGLVALESLFPPIPSEAILPLAGFVSGSGGPSFVLLVVAATAGSVAGSWALYGIAAAVGVHRLHRFVERFGRYFGVSGREMARAEEWFERRCDVAVLVGRCVPLIRSLVSLPAGLHRMAPVRFTVLTALGSAVWNVSLLGAGRLLGENWHRVGDAVGVLQMIVVAVVLVVIGMAVKRRVMSRGGRTVATDADDDRRSLRSPR